MSGEQTLHQFGMRLFRKFDKIGLFLPHGVPVPRERFKLDPKVKFEVLRYVLEGSALFAAAPPTAPEPALLVPSETPHAFCGSSPKRLMYLDRAIKYALLTCRTPVVVLPPFDWVEFDPALMVHRIFGQAPSPGIPLSGPMYDPIEWEKNYVYNVLLWLNSLRDFVLEGHILLSPSAPAVELRRCSMHGVYADLPTYAAFFESPVPLLEIAPSVLSEIAKILPDLHLDDCMTPLPATLPRQALYEMILQFQGDPTVGTRLAEDFWYQIGEYQNMFRLWWREYRLNTQRILTEAMLLGASPVVSGQLEAFVIARILRGSSHESDALQGSLIDVASIFFDMLDDVPLRFIGDVKAKYPAACEQLGIALDELVGELTKVEDPGERKERAEYLYRKKICAPIAEINARMEDARWALKADLSEAAVRGVAGGAGMTVSMIMASTPVEILSMIAGTMCATRTTTALTSWLKKRRAILNSPSGLLYQIQRGSLKRKGD